jgi:hypothetical protein
MKVTVDHTKVFELLDTILPRWKASPKLYPYNRKDAVIPQTIITAELRADKFTLACFYFYICIYMRGGIVSLQAFKAMIKIWQTHPELLDPRQAVEIKPEAIRAILISFGLGWDSENASKNWIENSKRLVTTWGGNPLSLLRNLTSYEEACRRILNKKGREDSEETHGFLKDAGKGDRGFIGFQYKMVSMLLYFYDWERMLPIRFLYPSPADFHNFRLGIACGAITIKTKNGQIPRAVEYISKPWRAAVMHYLKEKKADPVEVADALWLFSLVMCGNSPATQTKQGPLKKKLDHNKKEIETLLTVAEVEEKWDDLEWATRKHMNLDKTCLVCPFASTCRPVPARPYYTKGHLVTRKPLSLSAAFRAEHMRLTHSQPTQDKSTQHMLKLNPVDTS